MDELEGVEITVNNQPRPEDEAVYDFVDVPASFDSSNPVEPTSTNSLTVAFSELVKIKKIPVKSSDGETSLPSGLSVLVRDGSGNPFTDNSDSANELAVEPIVISDGTIDLPQDLPALSEIVLMPISPEQSDLSLVVEFLGCAHPGK